jgi:hypothetical protein
MIKCRLCFPGTITIVIESETGPTIISLKVMSHLQLLHGSTKTADEVLATKFSNFTLGDRSALYCHSLDRHRFTHYVLLTISSSSSTSCPVEIKEKSIAPRLKPRPARPARRAWCVPLRKANHPMSLSSVPVARMP